MGRSGSTLKMLLRNEDGNVTIIVAAAMVALCGVAALALDIGGVMVQKEKAQSAADAGALAGANDLLKGSSVAANTAYQMAMTNDPKANYTASADTVANTVSVTATQTIPLWFARVLGIQSTTIHAKSKAQIGVLKSATGIVPIGVPDQTFYYGQKVYLSEGAGNGTAGNYGYLDLPGGFESNFEYGYSGTISVGDYVSTLPGARVGQVKPAADYRMNESAPAVCSSYQTATSNCPRMLAVPVVDFSGVHGKSQVQVLGFASFFLEGLQGNGGHEQLVGEFIRMIRPGKLGNGTDYGTYGEKLIEP